MPDSVARLKTTVEGEVRIVELVDRKILDEAVIAQISQQLFPWSPRPPEDGAGFHQRRAHVQQRPGHVDHAAQACPGTGRQAGPVHIRPSIYEVFAITRLNEVFTISPTRREALGAATS